MFDFSKPTSINKNFEYGLMPSTKCQTPNPHSTDKFLKHLNSDRNS